MLTLFCDGGCKPNGEGGWAYVAVRDGVVIKEDFGFKRDVTNNKMELWACIQALIAFPEERQLRITSDSQYLVKGATEWLPGWLRNYWMNSNGDPVKNRELWKWVHQLIIQHGEIEFTWVKGHATNEWNIRADELATRGIALGVVS